MHNARSANTFKHLIISRSHVVRKNYTSLVIPKIVYHLFTGYIARNFYRIPNQIMYKFIWSSEWEKVGRSQLCCDVKEGGGKMIDINHYVLALRFNFIFKLFDNNYQSS